jgi:hypothetical protein
VISFSGSVGYRAERESSPIDQGFDPATTRQTAQFAAAPMLSRVGSELLRSHAFEVCDCEYAGVRRRRSTCSGPLLGSR